MRMRVLVSIGLLGMASACTTPFSAQVSRFQVLPPPAGQSFTIEALDPAKSGSIEFATYAGYVRQNMIARGFTEAPNPAAATLVVKFDYSVGPGRNYVESWPGMDMGWGYGGFGYGGGYGGWGYGGGRYGWGGYGGWGGGWGGYGGWSTPQVTTVTKYSAAADVRIARIADKTSLFEGRAQTINTSNQLPQLVPNLVRAMFTGFPGNSGETVNISFDPTKPPLK